MLAGHTHGGQIRLPVVGPIVSPSYYGVHYASGVFYVRPTLLHVSRGLSGEEALRINCRPEVSKLVLRSSQPITVPARPSSPWRPRWPCRNTDGAVRTSKATLPWQRQLK